MKKAIIAKKIGMTQVFTENGALVPVTVLEAGPCVVIQKKTMENDGYEAIQVGFGEIKDKHVTKPMKGHFEKAGVPARKYVKELRLEDTSAYEVGAEIKADLVAAGQIEAARGFTNVKASHTTTTTPHPQRGPMGHGSKSHRVVGSMGSSATPSRVKKGKRMPGHMGSVNVTIQNLEIVRADAEKNLLLIKGAVPGPKGSVLVIKDSVKA